MRSDHRSSDNEVVRVELKYCEHCGGLWVRERGAGMVYCEKCQPIIAELPVPKKKAGRIILPVRQRSVIDDQEESWLEVEAVGGVA